MHHTDGGLVILVLQIEVEQAQVVDEEHPLVHDGAAGQAGHIGAVAGLLEHAAHHIQFAVKVDALAHLGGLFDEALPDGRHTVTGFLTHGVGVYGHGAPCQKLKALFAGHKLEQLHGLRPQMLVLGEEEHTHAVFALVAEADVQLVGHLREETVADLQHDADAVAGLALGVLAGAVLKALHDGQRIADGLVALAALDVHHRADAAGIVLELGVIQAEWSFLLREIFHRLSHPFFDFPEAYPGSAAAQSAASLCADKKKRRPRWVGKDTSGTPLFRITTLLYKGVEIDSSDSCTKAGYTAAALLVKNRHAE